jgi:putative endonuclease
VVGVVNKRHIGTLGERIAEAFLMLKGHRIVRRNYRFAGREIDLLTRKDDRLVAVEVKLRRGRLFGTAVEAINPRQLERIRVALAGALGRSHLRPQVDAVVIDITDDATEMIVRHLEAVS